MWPELVDRFQGSRSERYVDLSKLFGKRSTRQSCKDYLRAGVLPEPQAVQEAAEGATSPTATR